MKMEHSFSWQNKDKINFMIKDFAGLKKAIRYLWRIAFFLVLSFQSKNSGAQTYFFDIYGVQQGLAQSKVYTIIQDRDDYVWLGTDGGASRFDGVLFENFTTEDGLAINGVQAIIQDKSGKIWFGHKGGGLTRFDGKKFEQAGLLQNDITSFSIDRYDRLWITTAGSGVVCIMNPDTSINDLTYEQYLGKRLSDQVFSSYVGRDSTLYFVTDIGIKKYNPEENDFDQFVIEKMPLYFQIITLLEDSKGDFWFGTNHDGLYKYESQKDSFLFYNTRDGLANNVISTIFEDRYGNIWAGTWGGGISRLTGSRIQTFSTANGLPDSKIRCITEDVEGNILIGTNENGLAIYKGDQFVSYSTKDGIIDNQVWAIQQDRSGNYWFGTNAGITIYNPSLSQDKQFRHITSEKYQMGNQIRFIKEDLNGHIWIGTNDAGAFEYIPSQSRFNFNYILNSYNRQGIVTAMDIDRQNNLWIGTIDGLLYYEINNNNVERLTQLHGLSGTDISAIFADSKGIVWVGARGKGLVRVLSDTIVKVDLSAEFTPTCITEDKSGWIWTGTEGQGVYAISGDTVAAHFSRQNGLLANLITLVAVDEDNNIYIGTNRGLNKYSRSEDKIFTYSGKNGFTGIETKNNAVCRDRAGDIWFGTVAGVTRYNPKQEHRLNIEPLTHITRMRINFKDREMKQGMKLRHHENSVIFDFTSICLINPDAVSYKYKLEGADIDWMPETDQTTAVYPALKPGKYIFMVKARNNDGIWNSEPIKFAFQIKPPFYQTWWFIIICILTGAGAILGYIKVRERNLRRENKILEEKVKQRTALVVAQKEELAQKNKDITDSIEYAKRIQVAILPQKIPFSRTFILFKPKAIVSGDFYWLIEKDGREFIAAVDCTGHGVPGAFMSIIGHNMLNKIVKEYGILKPSDILKHLDKEVNNTLQQTAEERNVVKDGMDMALVCFNKEENVLEFSGAYNPLFLIRKGELFETKGDRFTIGRSVADFGEKVFTNHSIKIEKGDSIYLFSDGYADQFGGIAGKKFKLAPMKDLLLKIQNKSMEEQKLILDNTIEAWRGNIEQIDDIMVIGRRF
jgi:ligand-binding sensor domain-containing protein/serine phosphatase RsbU (regulator of sigma subunit)